jgi:hypothetical protein
MHCFSEQMRSRFFFSEMSRNRYNHPHVRTPVIAGRYGCPSQRKLGGLAGALATSCPALTHLSIIWCTGITDAGLEALAHMANLRSLTLSGMSVASRRIVHHFGRTHRLFVGTCVLAVALM